MFEASNFKYIPKNKIQLFEIDFIYSTTIDKSGVWTTVRQIRKSIQLICFNLQNTYELNAQMQ